LDKATAALSDSLKEKGLYFKINEGDGAFYGPKIDIKLKDALNREWQCATIQCDFALPERFDLKYVASDGKEARPIMLHRVILGSLERFIGALLEHYAGALPLWLSPEQIRIIPIKEGNEIYAKELNQELLNQDFRVKIDNSNETLQKRIREAETERIPYILVIGDKEAAAKTIAVRKRSSGDLGSMSVKEFIAKAKQDLAEKK